jgi:hypothetical protein
MHRDAVRYSNMHEGEVVIGGDRWTSYIRSFQLHRRTRAFI